MFFFAGCAVRVVTLCAFLVACAPVVKAGHIYGPPETPPKTTEVPSFMVPQSGGTLGVGVIEGELMGDQLAVGGKLALGLTVGFLTGLIGTGIGYFVIGPQGLDGQALAKYSEKGEQYKLGFRSGWDKKTQTKKRNSFLAGGLLGTAAIVVVIIKATP